MNRSARLDAIRNSLDDEQKSLAQSVADSGGRLAGAMQKLAELQRYRDEYLGAYTQQVASGMISARLRDFQAFMARLTQAVKSQQEQLARSRAEYEFELQRWQALTLKMSAIGSVVNRWRGEEQVVDARSEQRDFDAFAGRAALLRNSGKSN